MIPDTNRTVATGRAPLAEKECESHAPESQVHRGSSGYTEPRVNKRVLPSQACGSLQEDTSVDWLILSTQFSPYQPNPDHGKPDQRHVSRLRHRRPAASRHHPRAGIADIFP